MHEIHVVWDLPDEPGGNTEHIAQHGFTQDDIEDVLFSADSETTTSRSTGELITFGYTSSGHYIAVVWEHVDADPLTIRPITAFEAPEQTRRRRRRKK